MSINTDLSTSQVTSRQLYIFETELWKCLDQSLINQMYHYLTSEGFETSQHLTFNINYVNCIVEVGDGMVMNDLTKTKHV